MTSYVTEFNLKEKKEFFNSFSALYEAGMPVGDLFKSIMVSTRNEKIKDLCKFVSSKIDKGKTIEEALSPYSKVIGTAYTALITAGEQSGKLENILSNICQNINKQQEIKSTMINALIYPVCMFFFAVIVGMLFQFIVIPSFRSISDYNIDPHNILIIGILKMSAICLIIAGGLFYTIKIPRLRKYVKNFFSSLWFIRSILTNYYLANFFYILSLAYESGIPASKSVIIANSVIAMENIRKKITPAEKKIENGTSISKAFNETGVFTGFALSQTAAGEEAGKLDKTFSLAAKDYESQMDFAIKNMLKLLGPLVLLFVGIIVAFVVARGYKEYYNAIFSIL